MIELNTLHNQSMDIAEKAFLLQQKGEDLLATESFEAAFQLEKEAALLLLGDYEAEPTRSILFRSAASLAMNAGDFREAEKMIANGLAGNPPLEIAEELRDLYEQVTFERHMVLKGVSLLANEFQLSFNGKETGLGIIKKEEYTDRVDAIEALAIRTVERISKLPFRESGPASRDLKEKYSMYTSIPRAASYAVTISIGQPVLQSAMFDESVHDKIIDEIFEGMEMVNQSKENELRNKIKDEAYFKNFLALSKKIAPDGEDVNLVGFTAFINGKERKLPFKRTRKNISISLAENSNWEDDNEAAYNIREITGKLSYADGDNNRIRITESNGKAHLVMVPQGLMNDIVKPYWDDLVTLSVRKKGRFFLLDDITKES